MVTAAARARTRVDQYAELKNAQARVLELESTLDAIRNGGVDGVVIEGPDGPRIFTLQSPDEPYRVLVERMNEGAVTLTPEGVVLFCNQRLSEALGIPTEAIVGSPFRSLIAPECVDGFLKLLRADRRGEARLEVELVQEHGGTLPVLLSVSQIPLDDFNHGLCLIVTDLTAQKRAEEKVRELNAELEQRVAVRTEELVAANKDLESFSYAVAHDLRTPLRHIHGFSEILDRDAESTLSQDGQHCLKSILTGVTKMEALVTHLLDLSRLSRQPLTRQSVDVKALIEQAVEQLTADIQGRQIEWRIGDLPIWHCDAALAGTVFMNLLSNAIKFTRGKSPAIIEIGQTLDSDMPFVFVKDNGAGFNPKYAEKLFGMFQRLHRQDEFEGSGVGLATVHRIVRRHGGKIWAEGALNQGAKVVLTLEDLSSQPLSQSEGTNDRRGESHPTGRR
jgi:PAS domain S-box-containing protein